MAPLWNRAPSQQRTPAWLGRRARSHGAGGWWRTCTGRGRAVPHAARRRQRLREPAHCHDAPRAHRPWRGAGQIAHLTDDITPRVYLARAGVQPGPVQRRPGQSIHLENNVLFPQFEAAAQAAAAPQAAAPQQLWTPPPSARWTGRHPTALVYGFLCRRARRRAAEFVRPRHRRYWEHLARWTSGARWRWARAAQRATITASMAVQGVEPRHFAIWLAPVGGQRTDALFEPRWREAAANRQGVRTNLFRGYFG